MLPVDQPEPNLCHASMILVAGLKALFTGLDPWEDYAVRRALPWLLVGLVAVGAGIGMGIGIAGQSPSAQAQISQILRATESAGTARFTVSSRTVGLVTRYTASGEVNFKTGSVSMTAHYSIGGTHPTNADALPNPYFKVIETGRFLYVYLPTFSASGSVGTTTGPVAYSWQREPLPTGLHNRSGILYGPMGFLQLPGSTQVLQDLGPSTVGGQAATEYQMGQSTCQTSASGLTQTYLTTPTTLWVDLQGRLIQGEATQTVVLHPPKGIAGEAHRSTQTSFVRLFDFGEPVSITAPPNVTAKASGNIVTSGCS